MRSSCSAQAAKLSNTDVSTRTRYKILTATPLAADPAPPLPPKTLSPQCGGAGVWFVCSVKPSEPRFPADASFGSNATRRTAPRLRNNRSTLSCNLPPQEVAPSSLTSRVDTDKLANVDIARLKPRAGGRVPESDLDALAAAEQALVVVHQLCDASDGCFSTVAVHGKPSHRRIHLLRSQDASDVHARHQLMDFDGEKYTSFELIKSGLTVKLVLKPSKVRTAKGLPHPHLF